MNGMRRDCGDARATPPLRLIGLHKAFGGLQVTRDVTLKVREGEIHALIGPNGAGKTTLIAQIAGEIRPDRGRICLAGRDVTRLSPHARARAGLARAFQVVSLMEELTVRENVLLAHIACARAWNRLWPPVSRQRDLQAAAARTLDEFGLSDMAAARPKDLAHGQRRLLELALAMAGRPVVLLLDEPLAGLGSAEARQMRARIASLRGKVPVLLVEHDMDAVFALADRISVLVAGRLIATGTPDEIRADAGVQAAYLGELPPRAAASAREERA
jgi:branched-chain amino acid transport system ATP-binding protein